MSLHLNPYNANFDGGEMNLYVPRIEEARIEVFMLMAVAFAFLLS